MKICMLSSMHPPFDKRVFDKEAVTLAAAGHDVVHLCPRFVPEGTVVPAEFKGVSILTYEPPSGLVGRIFGLFRLFRRARAVDADVYHCNEVDSWMVGVMLKLLTGKRCVFDVHEHYPSVFAEKRAPRALRPVVATCIHLLFRILTPFTDRIVLAKKSVSEDFRCRDNKKVLVRNYTPVSSLRIGKRCADREGVVPLRIVHLGLIGKARGWPQVLDAMSLVGDAPVHLHVIGEFNDGSLDEFRARVSELGLEAQVRISSWMPFNEAFAHLLDADVGLIAFQPGVQNHVFAMPHKMFDYMAAGLAVLCPRFAVEVAPVVEETLCGLLIDTDDPAQMADAICRLAGDRKEMLEMGLRGQRAVQDRYNWEAEARYLIEMYANMEKTS